MRLLVDEKEEEEVQLAALIYCPVLVTRCNGNSRSHCCDDATQRQDGESLSGSGLDFSQVRHADMPVTRSHWSSGKWQRGSLVAAQKLPP